MKPSLFSILALAQTAEFGSLKYVNRYICDADGRLVWERGYEWIHSGAPNGRLKRTVMNSHAVGNVRGFSASGTVGARFNALPDSHGVHA
jgi:hypothetical protein